MDRKDKELTNKDQDIDNQSSESLDGGKAENISITALELDIEHHFFIAGITQSGKSYFLKHFFDAIKSKHRKCIFFDYKNDPDHVKWIKKGKYPIFTTIEQIKRYWSPTRRSVKQFLMGSKPIQNKVIFRPSRPKGFAGAYQLLDDLADYVFRQGNMILFIDEIAPLMTPQKIPPSLYDCLVMGASRGVTIISVSQRPKDIHNVVLSEAYTKIFFRLNLEDDRKKVKGIADQGVADALHNLPNTYFIYVRADGYHQVCRLSSKDDKKKIKDEQKVTI